MIYQVYHIHTEQEVLEVDVETGEILNSYPLHQEKKSKSIAYTSITLAECRNPDQLKAVAQHTKTTRYKVKDWIFEYQNEDGFEKVLTKPVIRVLDPLIDLIGSHNVIICKRDKICRTLNCRERDLARKLRMLTSRGLAEDRKEGIPKGYIRIDLHPKIAFKGDFKDRYDTIKLWFQRHTKPKEGFELVPNRALKPLKAEPIEPPCEEEYIILDDLKLNSESEQERTSSTLARLNSMSRRQFRVWLRGS